MEQTEDFMFKRLFLASVLLVLGLLSPYSAFADGVVTGVVLDGRSGTPLRGASVTFEGTDLVVTTDLNGIFTANLPAGTLVATVTSEGYEAQKLIDIEVVDNQTINLSAVLKPLGGSDQVGTSVSDEITVEATAIEATETALLAERRSSASDRRQHRAIEISKNSGSDAAGSLKRSPGFPFRTTSTSTYGVWATATATPNSTAPRSPPPSSRKRSCRSISSPPSCSRR